MKSFAKFAMTALLAAVSTVGCKAKVVPPAPPLPVTVQAVGTAASGTTGGYSANVVADVQVDMAFKVNGYVQSILQIKGADGRMRNVQAGDLVAAGVVLATLKDDTYRQSFLRAKSELENARATQARAKADYGRYEHLLKEGVASRADYDTYKQRAESAAATVDSAQAAVRAAQVDLDDCKLKSPMKGLVLSRSIEVGTLVAPSTVGFQIGDTDRVKVVFGVPGSLVGEIQPGSTIAVTTEALPGQTFTGTITKVASVADPNTRIFDVEATIPNPDGRLRVGMIAGLHLAGNVASKPTLTVPMRSVVRPPDNQKEYAVYVVENKDGKSWARLKTVGIGPVVGDQVTIESGLEPGAHVIVKGSDVVYDGQEVSAVP